MIRVNDSDPWNVWLCRFRRPSTSRGRSSAGVSEYMRTVAPLGFGRDGLGPSLVPFGGILEPNC